MVTHWDNRPGPWFGWRARRANVPSFAVRIRPTSCASPNRIARLVLPPPSLAATFRWFSVLYSDTHPSPLSESMHFTRCSVPCATSPAYTPDPQLRLEEAASDGDISSSSQTGGSTSKPITG